VPPFSEAVFSAQISFNGGVLSLGASIWATEPRQRVPGVYVARTLIPHRANDISVRVVYVSYQPAKIPARIVVAELNAVDACSETLMNCVLNSTSERDQIIQEMADRETILSLRPLSSSCSSYIKTTKTRSLFQRKRLRCRQATRQ
jgi:hypothetical protein